MSFFNERAVNDERERRSSGTITYLEKDNAVAAKTLIGNAERD
jgi:hypothetical protein